MAYGNGNKNEMKRSIVIGNDLLTALKQEGLELLRTSYIDSLNAFSAIAAVNDPLRGALPAAELEKRLTEAQKTMTGLNKAYVEKARIAVKSNVSEAWSRLVKKFVGRCRFANSAIDYSKEDAEIEKLQQSGSSSKKLTRLLAAAAERRRWYNIPTTIAPLVTQPQLDAFVASLPKKGVTAYLFNLLDNGSDFEKLLVGAIADELRQGFRQPEYGKDCRFVAQIPLDYRVCSKKHEEQKFTGRISAEHEPVFATDEPLERLQREARLLFDSDNRQLQSFLEISHPLPKGEPLRLPLLLDKKRLAKFCDTKYNLGAFVLNLGHDRAMLRGVVGRPEKPASELDGFTHIVGRDFNVKNTCAWTVVKIDKLVSREDFALLAKLDKEESLQFYRTHIHPGDNVVATTMLDGSNFLKLVEKHCEKINAYSAEIACSYNRLEQIKRCIVGYLGLEEGELIAEDQLADDKFVQQLIVKFFKIHAQLSKLKQYRRDRYDRIRRIKRAWHGHAANIEVELCQKYNAIAVAEDLDFVTDEKDSLDYKGRVFNRMINHASRGQYARAAKGKHEWNGIPLMLIASYYSSQACLRHSRLGKRNGDQFICPECGKTEHADLHASGTIANAVLAIAKSSSKNVISIPGCCGLSSEPVGTSEAPSFRAG